MYVSTYVYMYIWYVSTMYICTYVCMYIQYILWSSVITELAVGIANNSANLVCSYLCG